MNFAYSSPNLNEIAFLLSEVSDYSLESSTRFTNFDKNATSSHDVNNLQSLLSGLQIHEADGDIECLIRDLKTKNLSESEIQQLVLNLTILERNI